MKPSFVLPLLVAVMLIGTCTQAAAAPGSARGARVWTRYLAAPAQFDLSLAEITFGAPARVAGAAASRAGRAGSVRVALLGSSGLNSVAAAVTRFTVRGRPRLLVLAVNRRPRGLLAPDIARVALRVTAPRRFGRPTLMQLSNPFTRRPSGLTPALCDLPIRGPSLTSSDLRSVLAHGLPLQAAGGGREGVFGAEAAVAQAYDVVCGRPYKPLFKQAVTQGSGTGCEGGQAGTLYCCPPIASCPAPPCPPCPCGPGPCPAPLGPARPALACPLRTQAIACPLQQP